MSDPTRVLIVVAAVGAALTGGVFFAFSTFVMKALDELPAPEGMAAMQAINRAAPSPWFMTALFGTGAVSLALAVVAIGRRGESSGAYLLVGSGLYLSGVVLTAAYHVPRNDALARVDPRSADAGGVWARYVNRWMAGNHVRTLTSLGGAVAFILALSSD